MNITPHLDSESTTGTSTGAFLHKVDELRFKDGNSSMLLGIQHENSGFSPVPFNAQTNLTGCTHMNSGLFVPLATGDWVERTQQCLTTGALVLDDVGEKTTIIPALEPTWIIETKPGSEQWVYLYNWHCQRKPA